MNRQKFTFRLSQQQLVLVALLQLPIGLALPTNCAKSQEIIITLDVLEQVTVAPIEDGVIKKFSAFPGKELKKNDLIFELAPEHLDLEFQKAQAELKALQLAAKDKSQIQIADANIRSAKVNVEELRAAAKSITIPRLEIVRAEANYDEAKAQLLGATSKILQTQFEQQAKQAEVDLLSFRRNQLRVTSPYSGRIAEVYQFAGDFIAKGSPVALIYRLDKLSGVALLNIDSFPPTTVIGKDVRVQLPDGDFQYFQVLRVSPRVDVAANYQAYFEVENILDKKNKQWQWLPGMTIAGQVLQNQDKNHK